MADSYCEKQLKRMCERLLWQSVSIDNVASLITVAHKYKAEVMPYMALKVCGSKIFFVNSRFIYSREIHGRKYFQERLQICEFHDIIELQQ